MAANLKRSKEIYDYYLIHGSQATQKKFNVVHEYIRRCGRVVRNSESPQDDIVSKNDLLKKISQLYSDAELKAIASGNKIISEIVPPAKLDFSGTSVKFCFFTDSHIGSIYFHQNLFESMLEECKKESVEFYCHAGDVTDGMSNRPDHIYSLTHIGYDSQKQYAIQLLSDIDKPLYLISGNHDMYFVKSNGANIVKDICSNISNALFLGNDLGRLEIKNTKIDLWHGEDGSSYATSYRLQKIVESLTGGSKPNTLLCGHTHKQGYFFERHIHTVSGGALSLQSDWMRSKRLANHSGFWIIKMTLDQKGQVSCFSPSWYPFYQ